ncbi:unnamed protein product [Oikopleura dioica]|uniref:RNA polymerase II subunit A C-terminal domain phosphatase n=1 Tax=Oikopleura dioica TaxID=34765 RepID=E4XIY6_OIKDI|nr:unnamed protein product [Oikopleura dioica]
MKDMCAACGGDLRKLHAETDSTNGLGPKKTLADLPMHANVQAVHSLPELRISESEAQRAAHEEIQRLHDNRKLVLLVDLDQTVIHTTQNRPKKLTKNTISFQLTRQDPWLWTRLRPFCAKFIHEMSEKYELHIVTFGSRQYAHKIAEILEDQTRRQLNLDSNKSFFSHRILSRDECVDPFHKSGNLEHLFPCGDSMCAIIDDRGDVWRYSPNCILVKKYHFFTDTGDINDPHAFKSTLPPTSQTQNELPDKDKAISSATDTVNKPENRTDPESVKSSELGKNLNSSSDSGSSTNSVEVHKEDQNTRDSDSREAAEQLAKTPEEEVDDDNDVYLVRLQQILNDIHDDYYKKYDALTKDQRNPSGYHLPDVRNVCVGIRKNILKGCQLVFSGVVPNGCRMEEHRAVKNARAMGAVIHERIQKNTTHLICARPGTAKHNEAKRKANVFVVNPAWLWVTYHEWRRQDESDFEIYSKGTEEEAEELERIAKQAKAARRAPRFSIPNVRDSSEGLSSDFISQMDKEVEEILSSSDDEDTAMDDFVPGVVNDGNDENTDSEADSANNANYDDLAMSDSNSSSTSYPPAKRCKLKLDPEASEDDEDDDEWDDKAAALLDDQF